ncbi:hypothetical protein MHU86_10240 [Fragilaria crotonensis]|nr:hypothetical protein MHU86_10240 [Fragilaria crotonensis]
MPAGEKWLQQHLDANNWWILNVKAKWLCNKLAVVFDEPAYYRDIYIWLPEQRWGNVAWPPCPSCSQQDVAAHGFQSNHYGRRVVSMTGQATTLSCREGTFVEEVVVGLYQLVVYHPEPPQRTFMGYHPTSRTRLPHGLGRLFPAFFTFGN